MKPTEVLQTDHDALRGQLVLLEGLLPLERAAQFPMRSMAYAITRRLRCHMEKEEALFAWLAAAESPQHLVLISARLDEHRDQRLTTTLLLDLLLRGAASPVAHITLCAEHLIDGLREHMAQEEAEVFPWADRAMSEWQESEAIQHMREITARHYPEGEPMRPARANAHEHLVIRLSSCRHAAGIC